MADDTDDTPKSETPAVTPRRRAPRKTSTTRAGAAKAPAKPRAPRTPRAKPAEPSTVEKVETAVTDAAAKTTRRAKAAVTKAESAVASAAKSVKPRSTKRATPRSSAAKKPAGKKRQADSTNKWGIAALGAGVATVGAVAAAALLSLRGSTPKDAKKAHAPDGSDASKSFEAGIADQNAIPDEA